MTETVEAKNSFIGDFKALTPKQWLAIIGGFAVSVILVTSGLYARMCLGFFIIAVLLYMIPHITGVTSPKVKATIGVVFIVSMLLVGTFAYTDQAKESEEIIEKNVDPSVTSIYLTDGIMTVESSKSDLRLYVVYAPVSQFTFGYVSGFSNGDLVKEQMVYSDGKYTYPISLKAGKYYYIEMGEATNDDATSFNYYYTKKVDTGLSSGDEISMNFHGAGFLMLEIGAIFFIMLIFSELMRRSARKTREKMEKDGRLYPAGYSKCKNCGTMVLPGEITCRKCGTPIDVPDDVKVLHKKDFFECSECGTEVPMDAKVCPKCGATFDEADEAVIEHEDGSVDSSTETFECSECGKTVPANAKRCPYCGADFDEDE